MRVFVYAAVLVASTWGRRAAAQDAAERVRVALWYAKAVVIQRPDHRPVLFTVAPGVGGSPQDGDAVDWIETFRRAGLVARRERGRPSGDTVRVDFSEPRRDSIGVAGAYYRIVTWQTTCERPMGSSGLHVAFVHCKDDRCWFDRATETGVGIYCDEQRK